MGAIRVLQVARSLRFLVLTGSRNRPQAQIISRMVNRYKYEGPLEYSTREEYDAKIKDAAKAQVQSYISRANRGRNGR